MKMEKIENPGEFVVCKFDGVDVASVYRNGFDDLKLLRMKWRCNEKLSKELGFEYHYLTLNEIVDQLGRCGIITVFIEGPLSGEILQWGNYGDSWFRVGELAGYA